MFSTNDLLTKSYHGLTPPMAKVGRFELTEPLGQGAFGSVWRAKDPDLGRLVAVKVPRPGLMGGAEFKERFARRPDRLTLYWRNGAASHLTNDEAVDKKS